MEKTASQTHSALGPVGGWIPQEKRPPQPAAWQSILGYGMEKITGLFVILQELGRRQKELRGKLLEKRVRTGEEGSRSESKSLRKLQTRLGAFLAGPMEADSISDLCRELSLHGADLPLFEMAVKEKLLEGLLRSAKPSATVSAALLHLFRSSRNRKEWERLRGRFEKLQEWLTPSDYGRFVALEEAFGLRPWSPPYQGEIFRGSGQLPTGKGWGEGEEELLWREYELPQEQVKSFLEGEASAAELLSITPADLHQVAVQGCHLLDQGQADPALHIFEGLAYLEPRDFFPYFALGCIRQRAGDMAGAVACYDRALELKPDTLETMGNRGECCLTQGDLVRALEDFRRVLEADPEVSRPITRRVRALVLATRSALESSAAPKEG